MNTSKKTSSAPEAFPDYRSGKFWILGWLPFLAYSFFVIESAVAPVSHLPRLFAAFNDKLIHGLEFFLLYALAVNALQRVLRAGFVPLALGYCAVMGILTECLQFFVPSRSPDIADFLADAAGFLTAGIFFSIFYCKKK